MSWSPEEDILWMEEELGQIGPIVMSSHGSALRVHTSSRGLAQGDHCVLWSLSP